ncbi:CGNR zinc finger domain-containing protein [Actinoplanes sp. NPDC051494]|uniref:CGNR zinc finger domain-containing protein n=1 Tax=Actinoplanes sp. NPDC051494 TaxID=3363907 RepID=UPI0037BD7F64
MTYSWSRIGGHLALDLCNTVSWRLDPARTIDRVPDLGTASEWFHQLTGIEPFTDHTTVATVHRLRAATTRILDAHLDAITPDSQNVATVVTAWRDALGVADVAPALPLAATSAEVGTHLALAIADLLGHDRPELRRCDGDGCGWLFLDTTRNHSRRWCDPADCGNRARVRAYTKRLQAAHPAGSRGQHPTATAH